MSSSSDQTQASSGILFFSQLNLAGGPQRTPIGSVILWPDKNDRLELYNMNLQEVRLDIAVIQLPHKRTQFYVSIRKCSCNVEPQFPCGDLLSGSFRDQMSGVCMASCLPAPLWHPSHCIPLLDGGNEPRYCKKLGQLCDLYVVKAALGFGQIWVFDRDERICREREP